MDISELQAAVGPKRVKTPGLEVEQFDIDKLLKVANAQSTFRPFMHNIGWSKAVPACNCNCPINPSCTDKEVSGG